MKDYYKILGVEKQASEEQIKKAYRKLAKQYHPDVIKDDEEKQKHMYEIQEAYQCLGNADHRKKYDAECIKAARGFMGGRKDRRGASETTSERSAGAKSMGAEYQGKGMPDMGQFEKFFGFQPGKGMTTDQDKKNQKPEGPIKPDEVFAAFFGKMT